MNSLSVLIYAIEFFSNLIGFLTFVLVFLIPIYLISFAAQHDYCRSKDWSDNDFVKFRKRVAVIIFSALLLLILIPHRSAMYMIAASEVGERVLKADASQKIINPSLEILNRRIQKELEKIK